MTSQRQRTRRPAPVAAAKAAPRYPPQSNRVHGEGTTAEAAAMRGRQGVPVMGFDPAADRRVDVPTAAGVDRDELTVTTFNIWFNAYFAAERYRTIADILARDMPDVMVFQEVTPDALAVFHSRPWIRDNYLSAAVVGSDHGNYGMLMLSRLPLSRVTYIPL